MKPLSFALAAALLTGTVWTVQAQTVQIGPGGGVRVTPSPGYGQTMPGPCQGLAREARTTRERMAVAGPAERAHLQARLAEIRDQQARCGR